MTGQAAWEAWKRQQAADPQCSRCGTHTNQRTCPDWCQTIENACGCRHPLCGECMRHTGTAGSGIGYSR